MGRSPRRRAGVVAVLSVAGGLLAGCHGSPAPAARGPGSPSGTSPTVAAPGSTAITAPTVAAPASTVTTTTTTVATAGSTATTATTAASAFTESVATVTAADLPFSWRPGCPVAPSQLRLLQLGYWGFDNQPHVGSIVVNAAVAADVISIFSRLFAARFPIRRMQPVDAYQGSDPASMAADNTSGFNCRYAVAPGPPQWSVHAFGEAIDVNTVENPYIEGGTITPSAGAAFVNRGIVRPGMAVPGGVLIQAFAAAGWFWGGRWSSPDYQHFSKTGG